MYFINNPRKAFAVILFIQVLFSSNAQNISSIVPALSDPGIPDGEEIRYISTVGDEVSYSTLRVRHESRDDIQLFMVENIDAENERQVLITRRGMIPLESNSLSRVDNATYENSTRLLRAPTVSGEEIFVLSIDDLTFLLRGYPFDDPRRLALRILGQGGADEGFSLEVVYRRKERIEVQGVEYQAHKLELVANLPGAMALFRGAIPKTFLWFSDEAPHQLLRYEGGAGFGSSDELVTEMISYRRISPD
jgi:hypothetical protein